MLNNLLRFSGFLGDPVIDALLFLTVTSVDSSQTLQYSASAFLHSAFSQWGLSTDLVIFRMSGPRVSMPS